MAEFARGARIKPKAPDDPLTFNQASFVCCDMARNQGMTESEFLGHMMRAWIAIGIVRGSPPSGGAVGG